jgi:hypothetical protein
MTLAVTKGAILGVQTEPLLKRLRLVQHLKEGEGLVDPWGSATAFRWNPLKSIGFSKTPTKRVVAARETAF